MDLEERRVVKGCKHPNHGKRVRKLSKEWPEFLTSREKRLMLPQ